MKLAVLAAAFLAAFAATLLLVGSLYRPRRGAAWVPYPPEGDDGLPPADVWPQSGSTWLDALNREGWTIS